MPHFVLGHSTSLPIVGSHVKIAFKISALKCALALDFYCNSLSSLDDIS